MPENQPDSAVYWRFGKLYFFYGDEYIRYEITNDAAVNGGQGKIYFFREGAPSPAGVAKMKAAVNMIAQRPRPRPVPPLPATSRDVSGKTFVFESNPIVLSFCLEFDSPAEATFDLQVANKPSPREIVVGLDGVACVSCAIAFSIMIVCQSGRSLNWHPVQVVRTNEIVLAGLGSVCPIGFFKPNPKGIGVLQDQGQPNHLPVS